MQIEKVFLYIVVKWPDFFRKAAWAIFIDPKPTSILGTQPT